MGRARPRRAPPAAPLLLLLLLAAVAAALGAAPGPWAAWAACGRARWARRAALGLPAAAAALPGARPAAAADTAATRARLKEAASSLDALLGRYEEVKQRRQGDAVRTAVNGKASPALAVQLQGSVMARDAEDPVAFADALDDYLSASKAADGLAYSSAFAKSGNWKVNTPENYLEQARVEVVKMRKDLDAMLESLG